LRNGNRPDACRRILRENPEAIASTGKGEIGMARHLVCMTFDFDAMSGFIARGMTSPTPISRGEFGAVAVPRILQLLGERHVPATFFIPGHTLATYPNESRMIADAGCEIGHHGWTHRPPATLTREEEEAELVRANELINSLTGANARGYRSPSWDLSAHSVELLLQHGFVYDSSMMGHDYCPYRVRRNDVITLEAPAVFGELSSLRHRPRAPDADAGKAHPAAGRFRRHLHDAGRRGDGVRAARCAAAGCLKSRWRRKRAAPDRRDHPVRDIVASRPSFAGGEYFFPLKRRGWREAPGWCGLLKDHPVRDIVASRPALRAERFGRSSGADTR
jgi:peptidoglycan/xylan/chitin deacetylase (PgdA/CDA1 family)